jgi:hypothetical protein
LEYLSFLWEIVLFLPLFPVASVKITHKWKTLSESAELLLAALLDGGTELDEL